MYKVQSRLGGEEKVVYVSSRLDQGKCDGRRSGATCGERTKGTFYFEKYLL